jgi:hypothetical protein
MFNKALVMVIALFISLLISPFILQAQTPTRPIKLTHSKDALKLQPEKARPVIIPRFQTPPIIDGRLGEEVWKQAAVLKDFNQVQPGDNITPSQPSEVLLGYDTKSLYIAFRAQDDPAKVRATVAKRDAIFDDDYVGLYLDTFNDQRKAYALFFNPFGVQADGVLTEGRGEDYTVDIIMESKGIITEAGYTVEIAIPFKSLRYKPVREKLWGIHVRRVIKRFNNEIDSWMPISRDKSGLLNQAGHIAGLEDISTSRTLEIIPSLILSETGKRVRPLSPFDLNGTPGLINSSRFINEPVRLDPGLTAKLVITPTVTLDLAINPDFAQVEADELVLTVNERFPIFFPERRPFFLEGVDVFQTPLNALNTRAIVDPDVAVKMTGKLGRTAFGLMAASDNAPGNFIGDERLDPINLRFLDKNAYVGVVRLRRDVGKESSIGMIATTYNFIEDHNHLGGIDGRFRLDQQATLNFQIAGTTSRSLFFDPELGRHIYRTGNGLGYLWEYIREGRHFGLEMGGEGRSADYHARLGFTRRIDSNFKKFIVNYKSQPDPKRTLISWKVQNETFTRFNWDAHLQWWEECPRVGFNFSHQSFINANACRGYERFFEEEFGPKRTSSRQGAFFGADPERRGYYKSVEVEAGSTPNKKYSFYTDISYKMGAFDFDFGGGPRFPRISPAALFDSEAPLDPGPGNLLSANFVFTYQPTDALRASVNYTKSKLVRYDTDRTAFDSNIFALRTTYQFTRFTFARARIDYDTLDSRVLGQFLVGWTPSPGTSFYLGYNDDLNFNGFNPFSNVVLQQERGFHRNQRRFFIKVSYLLRHSI